MAESADSGYHRRLDRSPEKEEFTRLPTPDKQLISELRSATEHIRVKLDTLRDENEDIERDAIREAALRKALEERMDQLVDMYGDPAVTDELRQRLPRAKKQDPVASWKKQLNEMSQKDDLNPEPCEQTSGEKDFARKSHSPPTSSYNCFGRGLPYPPPPSVVGGQYPNFPPSGYYPPTAPLYPPVVYMMSQPPATAAAAMQTPAPGAPSMDRAPNTPEASQPVMKSETATVQREQNRQIALLLAELDAARDLNKKLQQHLASTQQELQSVKIAQKMRETEIEAESARKASALVEEIYKAQKEREEAIMCRLKLANEERDEAVLKLRNLEIGRNQGDHQAADSGSDLNVKEILAKIVSSDSNVPINQHGEQLVDAINHCKQNRRQMVNEEMKVILEERDSAVAKCNKLEADVISLTRQLRGRTPDKQQLTALQAKLLSAEKERDLALSRLHKMDEEMKTLRIYYSLHKSLSQEANLRDQFRNTLETYQDQIKNRDSVMDQAYKENNRLLSQLKAAQTDKAQLEAQLSKAQAAQRHLEEKNTKLQATITLLRQRAKESVYTADD